MFTKASVAAVGPSGEPGGVGRRAAVHPDGDANAARDIDSAAGLAQDVEDVGGATAEYGDAVGCRKRATCDIKGPDAARAAGPATDVNVTARRQSAAEVVGSDAGGQRADEDRAGSEGIVQGARHRG